MTLQCDNCNQTILPTDTVCWHCGKELTPAKIERKTKVPVTDSTRPETSEPISITAVSIFALITLLTILLLIVVTNALSAYSAG
jgi:uncharacterized OB-fold protein